MLIRAISAILGVAVLYGTWFFFNTLGLILICSVVTFVACGEYSFMVEKSNALIRSLFVCISFAFYLVYSFFSQSLLTFISFFILLVGYFILCSHEDVEVRMKKLTTWTVGVLYCGAFTGTITLGVIQYGGTYFAGVLILSFLTDTFAYFGGRAFGKTPLAPQISPKKTREGSLAGLLGGSSMGLWFLSSLEHESPFWVLVMTCIAASLFAQVGDLFESAIKRDSGVKDSGRILPGHGGFLDRIDGVLFAGPVVLLWMQTYWIQS